MKPFVRSEVVARLRRMSVLHTRAFWEQRRRDRLGPHAVAYFYLEPGAPAVEQLRTATRIFLADEDVTAGLPLLLYGMAQHAHDGFGSDPRFDPRTEMSNRRDPMSTAAVFIGVGAATLDTPHGSWEAAERNARNELDLPGRAFARLIDGTHLLLDRGGPRQFNQLIVASSVKDDNTSYTTPSLQWTWDPTLAEVPQTDPTYQTWNWLGEMVRLFDRGAQR